MVTFNRNLLIINPHNIPYEIKKNKPIEFSIWRSFRFTSLSIINFYENQTVRDTVQTIWNKNVWIDTKKKKKIDNLCYCLADENVASALDQQIKQKYLFTWSLVPSWTIAFRKFNFVSTLPIVDSQQNLPLSI